MSGSCGGGDEIASFKDDFALKDRHCFGHGDEGQFGPFDPSQVSTFCKWPPSARDTESGKIFERPDKR